jgi:serine/threonine protein kinase
LPIDLLGRLQEGLAERYVVEREVGRGAMATVFLAHDVKHERPVALKVLRPELAINLGAERFLREIKLIAQLQHPHILPLYDSGECAGCLYYVSPYVGSENLRDRMHADLQMPLDDALRLIGEVGDALAYAHQHGIMHRDIKPENILLLDDHAVIADFGIARAIRMSGGHRLSEPGITIGTPTYMSPEQASGDQVIDGRSDIYSLGCVLYEALTGVPPFVGTSERQIIAAHFTQAAPRLSTNRSGLPARLDLVLEKALAKNPGDRFQSADDFVTALRMRDEELPEFLEETTGRKLLSRRALSAIIAALVAIVVAMAVVVIRRPG